MIPHETLDELERAEREATQGEWRAVETVPGRYYISASCGDADVLIATELSDAEAALVALLRNNAKALLASARRLAEVEATLLEAVGDTHDNSPTALAGRIVCERNDNRTAWVEARSRAEAAERRLAEVEAELELSEMNRASTQVNVGVLRRGLDIAEASLDEVNAKLTTLTTAIRTACDGLTEEEPAEAVASLRRALDAERERADAADAKLSLLGVWVHEFGAALKPTRADTYGEGIRDAKAQVENILSLTAAKGTR